MLKRHAHICHNKYLVHDLSTAVPGTRYYLCEKQPGTWCIHTWYYYYYVAGGIFLSGGESRARWRETFFFVWSALMLHIIDYQVCSMQQQEAGFGYVSSGVGKLPTGTRSTYMLVS